MAYQSRARKRVQAIPRAPDGSAFQTCDGCGISVAIALTSMHDCGFKNKKCKTQSFNEWQGFEAQPRSAFRFLVEDFMNKCEDGNKLEIENKAWGIWKDMTNAERQPYVLQAGKLNSAYVKLLQKEENEIESSHYEDEEADSAEVGKYDKNYEHETFDIYSGYGSSDESDFLFF